MFKTVPTRDAARLIACALALSPSAVLAQSAPFTPGSPSAHSAPSEAVFKSAAANADFTAFSLARANAAVLTAPEKGALTNARDLDCMTQAVYFEARGEPMTGQAAVAQVVLNRVRHPAFPKSVCGVVFQRAGHSCQFSWACHRPHDSGSAGQWAQARAVAARVLAGEVIAGIGFATHFNGARAGGFGSGLQRVAQIGAHAFYRFNGAKGSAAMFAAPFQLARAQAASAPAAHTVYASLAPLPALPTRAQASRLLTSASASVQLASAAVKLVVAEATQSAAQSLHLLPTTKPALVGQAEPTVALDEAAAQAAAPAKPSHEDAQVVASAS